MKHLAKPATLAILSAMAVFTAIFLFLGSGRGQPIAKNGDAPQSGPEQDTLQMIKEGRQTFRFDTFGDEEFWGDALKLHQAIAGAKLEGVGPGVSPKTALTVGLKVDVDALPPDLVQKLKQKQVDLDDPATTVALLKLDAVLGVKGILSKDGKLQSVGITCAICHSTVDNSLAPGISELNTPRRW